ncbi:unnamed protein product [Effrenium voratum]|nr:unnamed protein product [Effrenium voratum]
MDIDLLNPDAKEERSKHKLKRMIQSPNSFFMDVKCPGCLQITTVFSHAQTVVLCGNCNVMLCQPTGGLARLTAPRLTRRGRREKSQVQEQTKCPTSRASDRCRVNLDMVTDSRFSSFWIVCLAKFVPPFGLAVGEGRLPTDRTCSSLGTSGIPESG